MRKAPALTLVETLATLVVVALVVTAALRVTTTLARSESVRRRSEEPAGLEGPLGDLLRLDLLHAERWRCTETGLALQTRARLAPGRLALEHRRALVTYEVCVVGGRRWLVRRQESEGMESFSELVACGITKVRPEGDGETPREGADWRAVPDPTTVAVEFESAGVRPMQVNVARR